jgi:hypothetical protein
MSKKSKIFGKQKIWRANFFAKKSMILASILLIILTACSPLSESSDPVTSESVDSNLLKSFLPEVPAGWSAEDIESRDYTVLDSLSSEAKRMYVWMGGSNSTEVTIYFRHGEVSLEIEELKKISPNIQKEDGEYREWITVQKYTAIETYDPKSGNYAYGVFVGPGITVSMETNQKSDLDLFASQIDYGGLAALR